ncbi:MAG TPA: DNA adenine methylase, partial [Thermopetrobacter sp.]|nr:DNA adenine methylase [Thermopetrobacter sp.]
MLANIVQNGYPRGMQSYSPFRYPGGKARLAEWMLRSLHHNGLVGGCYVEPYAGGAGIAILLLVQEHVNHVVINDVDLGVFAFWRAVKEYPKELMALVRHARLSVEEHARQREIYLNPGGRDVLELGFAALYLNRTSRSGILRGGP